MSLRRPINMRLDNKILTDKNEVDNDEAESHMITGFMTLELQLPSFLALASSNMVLIGVC